MAVKRQQKGRGQPKKRANRKATQGKAQAKLSSLDPSNPLRPAGAPPAG